VRRLLLLNCILIDFAAFVVVFAVTRGLAEQNAAQWFMGVVGAGLSFNAGVGSLLGGWLSHRFDGRWAFILGAAATLICIAACGLGSIDRIWFLPMYWLLGVGLGFQYPPLIGWLNQNEGAHVNRQSVSHTLIVFCVAWNLGMMGGQLTAGSLFSWGREWIYGVAFGVAVLNFAVALLAARLASPSLKEMTSACDSNPPANEIIVASKFKLLSWIANLGGMFGGSMVIHLLPDLAVAIGVAPTYHGMLLASWRTVIIATYLLLHVTAFWHYRFAVSLGSQLLAAAGLVVIAQAESAGTLLLGLSLLGQLVGFNYFSGLFYSTVGSSQDRRALAAGIHEATLAAGMAVGTVVGGALGTFVNFRTPYFMAAVVLLILMIVQVATCLKWEPRSR